MLGQTLPKLVSLGIVDHTAEKESTSERDSIGRIVGRAARHVGRPRQLDDRHRRLGGDPPNLAPKVLVEHDVANDQEPLIPKRTDVVRHVVIPQVDPHVGKNVATKPDWPPRARSRHLVPLEHVAPSRRRLIR
jgi:hypothetical protein